MPYTYEGVYMRYLRGGKTVNSHFGMISKLQWPKLFMKSIYAIYPTIENMEAVPESVAVNIGMEKSKKYTICSANGWMTAVKMKIPPQTSK